MVRMDAGTRAAGQAAIDELRPGGATAIGTWLMSAVELFKLAPATQRHAILLTDGKIEGEDPRRAAARPCDYAPGVFQCDCRGVGSDWRVDQLREIATALLGSVDIVAEPADLEADFEAMMRAAMGRGVAHATLRLWAPQGSEVQFVRQVAPEVLDLTATRHAGVAAGHRGPDRRVGRRDAATTTWRSRCRRRPSATSAWPPAPRSSSTTRSSPRGSCGRCGPTTPT